MASSNALPFSDSKRAEHHIARRILATPWRIQKKRMGRILEPHFSAINLAEIVQRLMDEEDGCPWCDETSAQQIVGWLRSEVREVALELDLSLASDGNTRLEVSKRLQSEIGDLLFDSFLLASLCERQGLGASLSSSASAAAEKIRRRCPYVFDPNFNIDVWQLVKREEKANTPSSSVGLLEIERTCHASQGDAVVIFTKVPTMSKSKTRLIKHMGVEGAYAIAVAMLEDAIVTVSTSVELKAATKVILFTPSSALEELKKLIVGLGLVPESFHLTPMTETTDLTSSDLGTKLASGLNRVRELERMPLSPHMKPHQRLINGSIAIMGMDCPELKGEDIGQALSQSRRSASAQLLPSSDGGYVLIVLPPAASHKV
jgi:NTP pyrophosphatase (non-canonical NTP hydrolase)/2-phospho-L-lactate guanylyltransferase (CobY/MobA/RfbA family)